MRSGARSGPHGIGEEAIDDPAFLQVIRSHLDLHFVTGKDTYAVNAHAPCEVAQKLMIFGLFTRDADSECGIGETLFHNTDKFDYVLGHRESGG